MFTTLIVQPIFNVLSAIYALIPGHDFGVAIILFTVVARIALYPLLKKQLKNTKAMRELQPELKKIKAATKGDRQQEQILMMELYKEKEIKPLSQIGLMILQIVVFLALFSGLRGVVNDRQKIVSFSYPVVQNTSWMKEVSADINKFDEHFLGTVDLNRAAIDKNGQPLYIPALLLVMGSAIIQFLQIKQTMPQNKSGRKLRDILKDANNGQQADSSEINAAMGKNLAYFMPFMIFILTISFPAALSLYWFVGGLIAYAQQRQLLQQDEYMMEAASAVVVRKKSLKPEPEEENVKIKITTKKSSKTKGNKRKR